MSGSTLVQKHNLPPLSSGNTQTAPLPSRHPKLCKHLILVLIGLLSMYSSSPFILCFTKLTFLSNGMFPISMVMGFLNILSRLIKMSNPHHHLALIASIICVGLIPDIFPSSDKETPHMPSLFADHLHNLDWVSYNCKDASEAGPFITMVSSSIINMYDVNFCISLHTKSQLDLKAWFNKHSMFFSLSFSLQLI